MSKRVRESIAILTLPEIDIPGLASGLTRKIRGLDGIVSVNTDYILDRMTITYDTDRIDLSRIKKEMGIGLLKRQAAE
ncbi:MAG: heavy-metal-associated domain-containing protein [Nitrososphaerales archaeon]|jgi:copper chaperone CopZ